MYFPVSASRPARRAPAARRVALAASILVALFLSLIAAPAPSYAAAFTVNTTLDTVDANPGDGTCADSSGQCSLRAAIGEANALAGADSITLPAGTYTLSRGGANEDLNDTGDLDIRQDLTITGAGRNTTIIDANSIDRAFHIVNGVTANIANLTVRSGSITAGGGGILNQGTLSMAGVSVSNNTATNGGGIYSPGTLHVSQCEFSGNSALVGGAVDVSAGSATIERSVFINNTATAPTTGGGGAISALNTTGVVIIANSTFSGNHAAHQGGVLYAAGAATAVTLVNDTLYGNSATGADSAIRNTDATVTLQNTILASGTAGLIGNCSLTTSLGNNLSDDGTCGGAGDLLNTNPQLGPLADNGGATQTMALLPGSPALGAANAAACAAAPVNGVDQRGHLREPGICDIGAFQAELNLTVNSTTDATDAAPGNRVCATSGGFCSLRAAIQEANAFAGTDTITIPSGTYTLSLTGPGEDAGSTGDLDILEGVTITGAGRDSTFISGSGDRVLDIASGVTAYISRLTVTNGHVTDDGGGIRSQGAHLALDHLAVVNNIATGDGGGVWANGQLTVQDSLIESNNGWTGGGIAVASGGSGQIFRSAVLDNAAGDDGGGIVNGSPLYVENTTIAGNHANGAPGIGAAIYFGANLTVRHSTLVYNTGQAAGGSGGNGGIYGWVGTPTVSHSILAWNKGTVGGGDTNCTWGTGLGGFNLTWPESCGAGTIQADPLLGVRGYYGGPTPLYPLLLGSPAIDAGDPAFASPPDTDQRGSSFGRVAGGRIDIGAFEWWSLIVNSTADAADAAPGDGICDAGGGACTLRAAIGEANALVVPDSITFAIPGPGAPEIPIGSPLPPVANTLIIDAATQPGGVVRLHGSATAGNGLEIIASSSIARGLEIYGFPGAGIVLNGNGNLVEDNSIHNNTGTGVKVAAGMGNVIQSNAIYDNGVLGIDACSDVKPTKNMPASCGLPSFPILTRATTFAGHVYIDGALRTAGGGEVVQVEVFASPTCSSHGYGEGRNYIGSFNGGTVQPGPTTVPLAGIDLAATVPEGWYLTTTATVAGKGTSEFSNCMPVHGNESWTRAGRVTASTDPLNPTVQNQALTKAGQARWYKFSIEPGSKVMVSLSGLPANYDLALYKDIAAVYAAMAHPTDTAALTRMSAEFAPDGFMPDGFMPDGFMPDGFMPDGFMPDGFMPDGFMPDGFMPDGFMPDGFMPDGFMPDGFMPDGFMPDGFMPDRQALSSAPNRSVLAASAAAGTAPELIVANTWENTGDFYVRVSGRNGAYDAANPFHLEITLLTGPCANLNFSSAALGQAQAGNYRTLILTDMSRIPETDPVKKGQFLVALQTFAGRGDIAGHVVDVSSEPRVAFANGEASRLSGCPYAKNVVATAIRDIVINHRNVNPIEYVVIAGGDDVIPFFRHPDRASLASEKDFVPPVRDDTASQASLRLGYVLSQDDYGAREVVSSVYGSLPIVDLAVGRLVETPGEIVAQLAAYPANGALNPTAALVTGYDFILDGAQAVDAQLAAGLGTSPTVHVDRLYPVPQPGAAGPQPWTADMLRTALLGSRHDLIFLGGHFSAGSALAADYETRLYASEVAASTVNLANAVVFSIGCHSGYNTVDAHGMQGVTPEPDWSQAFARKGAVLIAGTGYQYGDTDFVEYDERLYLEFSKQLRAGAPGSLVPVGKALVAAKQAYLAATPAIRGIHEKALLETTLYGLPMLGVNMPGERLLAGGKPPIVTAAPPFETDPGLTLGLGRADVTLAPSLETKTASLTGPTGQAVTATYLRGPDGVVANPAEPVLPLATYNASLDGTVLRGAGFREATFVDQSGVTPLTGAPASDLGGVHPAFFSDVFYPARPWSVNYYGSLAGGSTMLNLMPAQYRTEPAGSTTGILRKFTSVTLRLYYSANTAEYGENIPALAGPPVIGSVEAFDTGSGTVQFHVHVLGDPTAGIQEVWVTYVAPCPSGANPAQCSGRWASLDLAQTDNTDSTLWTGTLNGVAADVLRFMVQATNGTGLVTLGTNRGAYYAISPATPPAPPPATSLQLVSPPSAGFYGSTMTVSALLTSGGNGIDGEMLIFSLAGQSRRVVTTNGGHASATLTVAGVPGQDEIRVAFTGDESHLQSSASTPFQINKQGTVLALVPGSGVIESGSRLVALLRDASNRPLVQKTIFFAVDDATGYHVYSAVAGVDGRAVSDPVFPAANTSVTAYFGTNVPLGSAQTLPVVDDCYDAATATANYSVASGPVAVIEGMPGSGSPEGAQVTVSGAGSTKGTLSSGLTAYAWRVHKNGLLSAWGNGVDFSFTPDDNGSYVVALTVTDDHGGSGTTTATLNIVNVNPSPTIVPASGSEGSAINLTAAVSDPGTADTFTYAWSVTKDSQVYATGSATTFSVTPADNGDYIVTLIVTDDDGGSATATAAVAVANVAPTVSAITAPVSPVAVNTAISALASFSDPGTQDTHTATWAWGDTTNSPGSVSEENGTVSGQHTYTAAGVYTVKLATTDKDGAWGDQTFRYIVVYDPSAGFVTGGGWINSPSGAYAQDPTLTGKASFGFVSRYHRGQTVPSGDTDFVFCAGNMDFESTAYEWLVIAGARAQFKGSGTINEAGNYGFLLSAIDGQVTGGGGVDRFRIKIWDEATGAIVYDNQMGAAEDAAPATALGGGSIVIHN